MTKGQIDVAGAVNHGGTQVRRMGSGRAGPRDTYIKVHGHWRYLYRAIDRNGALVDVMFSEHRDMAAAKAFFQSAKTVTDVIPDRVTTDGPAGSSSSVALRP